MKDERMQFLVDSISTICQVSDRQNLSRSVENAAEIGDFLNDPRLVCLRASCSPNEEFDFTCQLNAEKAEGKVLTSVLFVKRSFDPLSPENISQALEVHTIHGSPLNGLFNSLRGIWCPTLLENENMTEKLPPRVKQLLAELQSALSTAVKSDQTSSSSGMDLENVADILEPGDEAQFWLNLKKEKSKKSSIRSLAESVDNIFKEAKDIHLFQDISTFDIANVGELVGSYLDVLNNLWLLNVDDKVYPQTRMAHLFDCIGGSLVRYTQSQLVSLDIWSSSGGNVKLKLQTCIRICEQWCNIPKQLTSRFWRRSNEHPWKGNAHEDDYAESYKHRLEQVHEILTLSEELSQILSADEKSSFQLVRLFEPLKSTNPILYNPYTEPQWVRAIKEFERLVEPVEAAVANRFRRNVAKFLDRPLLLMGEFQRYKNLMKRPTVRRALVSERETLLSLLRESIKKMDASVDREDFGQYNSDDDNGSSSSSSSSTNRNRGAAAIGQRSVMANAMRLTSPQISAIVYLRQLGSKATAILSTSKVLLDDLETYAKFSSQCETFISRVKNEEDIRFDSWLNEMNRKLEDGDDGLKLNGALMGWKDGVLVVNFSDDLVRFLREFRQLDELGFDLPKPSTGGRNKSITDRAQEAEKYYRYGILLKKTANFYNSISEQLIDVQEELLLGSLSSFAALVSKPSQSKNRGGETELTWSNPAECESYIKTLQEAAEKLSSENRWLRKVHESLCVQTLGLMSTDLHRQGEVWKSKWRAIKDKMATVRTKYSEKDSRQWVLHWDHQIYKALEASYQMGLECLNENLPEIKIELVFANKCLEFKPPMEQIRQTYYRELKKFVNIPNTFEGFGNTNLYRKMGSRNTRGLVQVYTKAETLFDKLNNVLTGYESWVRIGQVDIDTYLEANVHSSDDYVANFKMLRVKRKDIDRLPDIEKVDCCVVSTVPLKVYLDELLLRIGDTLLVNLRRSLMNEFKEVDQFLESSAERLTTLPKTVEDFSIAKKQWKEIDTKKSAVMTISKNCVDKKKLLLQYAPGTAIDISEITQKMANLDGEGGRWDDFEVSLEAYNDIIEKQKETLRASLEEEEVTINIQIDKFSNKWKQLKPKEVKSWDPKEIEKVFDTLSDWKKQFGELQENAARHAEGRTAFGMSGPRFDGLGLLVEDLNTTTKSWDLLKDYMDELKKMSDEDWISFSDIYALQDFAMKWSENLKQSFTRGSYDSIAEYILTNVEKMKKSVPALKYCKSEAFKEEHWSELLQGKLQLQKDLRPKDLKVEHFLSRLDILMEPSTLAYVKNLQARALGEVQIREAIEELKGWKMSAEVKFLTMEESGRPVPLMKDWKDLFLEIGDKQSLLGSLKESEFFKAFSDVGLALEAKISTLDDVLHTLNLIQRKWVYLEPIFSRGALPAEESRFNRVDESFKDIMNSVVRDPKLFNFADEHLFPKLSENLKHMLDQLERCQKALADFLEAKRSAMPRFYFIGDDDLLEILGQAKNPAVIQSHLKKLFQGINKVKFDTDFTKIIAMISSSNEVVDFKKPVVVNEKVEDWLEQLATEMRVTLASLLEECLQSKTFDWKYPSQILCLAQAIRFTESAEIEVRNGKSGLMSLKTQLTESLKQFTAHDLSSQPLIQLKMKSLVMDLVHNIDVVDQLLQKGTERLSDWQWSKQLRYYFEKGKAVVKMHDAKFEYTYEYQGNAPKLVHTPLTDRCYLTLTQGMHMGFGGNPYGPAGTGKTESVKALASCFGRQVLVFNCDEALESTSMVRIFIGIVKCGAWGCFDEFNRLKEDQLSAISQQIQIIQDSIKSRTSPIILLGREIDVNFNSGIFVTLNPAGKGYGGRSRLPDNLKALFRPVAMGAPDNELIAEVSLVTEGFRQSKDLASKIVSLFKLSRQLLSAQQHYDWGLRALKAVLNSGGRLIQNYKLSGSDVTSEMEYEILIKAVRVNTLSKLTFGDTTKFLALIGDVFPGVTSADITGGELEAAIKEVMKEKPFFLVEDSGQIKKMIQLKESLDQRMGCVIVGPSGCGKSTLWRVLKSAMIKCGKPVVTHVMNPKSMPRERLLGHMDLDTREWADGVLTDAARKVVKESSEVSCWIICDGDVDPEWIESLNSVLDDNHLLTLPNGERISFGPNVNFLFETHDLKFASPATVSRMGMIFLSDEDLDVARLIQRWLSTLDADHRISMSTWIDEFFYKALDFILKNELTVDTTLVGTVMNGLSQIKGAKTRHEFICGLIRGIGGNLSLVTRSSLAKEIFQWSGERPPDLGAPLDCYAKGNVIYSFTSSNGLGSDSDGTSNSIDIKDIGESSVIPTVNVQRTLAVLEGWLNQMEPFILVGPEGCGKSMIINHAIRRRKNIGIATLHCNAQTTSDDVISKIAQACSLYSSPDGRVYRPRDCERLILYLKDINLPRPDMYDTCQLIAFLQQIITFDGFYDEALEFLRLERIQIVASINAATTVGRHQLSTRFTAVVRISVVDYPETAELASVYDTFLSVILRSVKLSDAKWLQPSEISKLANLIVEIYQKTREKFTVDDRRHYLFTPRDMTLLVKNLCRYRLDVESFLDVIAYESSRIFRDRLVGTDACNRFDQQLSGILRSQFRHTLPAGENIYFTSLTLARGANTASKKAESKEAEPSTNLKELLGGSLSRMNEADFKKLITQGILYYEREERDLNMLLFSEILENVAHVDRVISSNSGHLLLVGKSGVGRRNAVTVASYMLGYNLITPSITRNYGPKQFSVDVKIVLDIAGIKGENVVFLVEDFQITKESILEIVNSLLSSGEVPGLYTHEELEPLLSSLRKIMQEEGSQFRTPYEFFVARVRKNLHVAICMDPGHPLFLYRCESNPALYSHCSVLWIGEWRTNSLREIPLLMDGISDILHGKSTGADDKDGDDNDVDSAIESKRAESKSSRKDGGASKKAGRSGGSNQMNPSDPDDIAPGKGSKSDGLSKQAVELIEMVMAIHDSCIGSGATPMDYVSFLKSWHSLYTVKKMELLKDLGHLEAGLSKLDSATEIVNDLRTNASQQRKDLTIAQAAADRAMEEISKAISSSTERRNEVGEVKKTVVENEEKTVARKKEIEMELEEIQPILESAKHAVGSIKPEHLNEIRSLTAPPEAIADVLAAVLMMLGTQDLSWLSMKKFLSNRGVKDDILNYDAKRISPELRKNVAKLLKKKPQSFDDASIQRVSVAAAPLAAWVKANIRYSLVIEKIEPLQQELEEEVTKLEKSQKRLIRCEEELKEIDNRISQMKKEFTARTSEAERLKNNLSIAGSTLDKAERLIGQLSGEQARWKHQAGQLKSDIAKLPMKMLLAAGFCTYLAKTPEDIRASMINKWQDITSLTGFIFKRVMSTESELLQWKAIGLPSDELSQENGLVITYSLDRTPFVIDPASASTEWLRSYLSKDRTKPLEVVTPFDVRFMNQVELAVRFGKTLLILEVDGIEPTLFPLCRKDLRHQGPRWVVTIGDKTIDYNESFRMFLVTRNPSPDIPPDAAALVSVINFTVTRSGLEGQLLGLAIQHEQPELEQAKGEMLKKEEDFKVQLAKLEKELLEALATAEGNLLENTSLIESLTKTKEKSAEIEEALVLSADASIKLDQQREVYRPFAVSGAKLFFIVKSLQNISNMYQFSLASFLILFKQALAAESTVKKTEDRLEILCSDIEVRVLYFVGRALFKADRPMFALHLVKGMHADHFQPREWDIFTGELVASVTDAMPKGFPTWAPSDRKAAFRLLTEQLPHLVNALEIENGAKWQRFATEQEAEKNFPAMRGVSSFQKVLIVQAFRPDRLQSAILQFCIDLLRIESVSPPPLSLAALHEESTALTPLLLISSPGADASKELQEYASKTIGLGNYEELAMGGGQQEAAQEMLRRAAKNGSWLCLKNLHLVVSWLTILEKELSVIEDSECHPDFRLWLTSESHPSFTSILLQQSLKATFESPPGVKKNVTRTFDSWDSDHFDANNPIHSRLMFLLALFHAIMQERRTYIPQGWTKFYEFSYGDLRAGTFMIENVTKGKVNGSDDLDWETIHGLMEDAIYGGRIDNPVDLRILRGYLNLFFTDRLVSDKSSGVEILSGTPLRMPSQTEKKSFKKIISQLQDTDAPFIFSLPDNIERSLQRTNSTALIKQLRILSAVDSEGAKFDREKWRSQLGPILELWQQLTSSTPGLISRRVAGRNGETNGPKKVAGSSGSNNNAPNPLDDFVLMEYELSGDICASVDASLSALKKVLFGSGLLTPAIQTAALSLLNGMIPSEWTKQWEGGPDKPKGWLREIVRKRISLTRWKSLLGKAGLLSSPLSLGDLFNPATFINALRQQTARQLGLAIDLVKMVCSWDLRKNKIECPLVCTLANLILQGAMFHSGALQESPAESAVMTPTPEVSIGFVSSRSRDTYESYQSVSIPIYLTPTREDYLMELQMPTSNKDEQDHWVLSGVALFLIGDD